MNLDEMLDNEIDLGNEKVLKHYYGIFFQTACSYATDILKVDEVAGDIVQEVFIRFWKRSLKMPNLITFKSYLYNSVRNSCLNYLRDNKMVNDAEMLLEYHSRDKNIEYLIIEKEIQNRLLEAIYELPPVRQKIMFMRIKGMSFNDIADELELSINTVKVHKKFAHKQLREKLKDYSFILNFLFF